MIEALSFVVNLERLECLERAEVEAGADLVDQACNYVLFLDPLVLTRITFVFARVVAAVELVVGARRALDVVATEDFIFEVLPRVGAGYDGAASMVLVGRARDDRVTHLDVSDDVASTQGLVQGGCKDESAGRS